MRLLLALEALFLAAVVVLAWLVREQRFDRFDVVVRDRTSGHGWWELSWNIVVDGLQPAVTAPLLILLGVWLSLRRRDPDPIMATLLAFVAASTGTVGMKRIVARPDVHGALASLGGSFPSGHEAMLTTLLGMAVLLEYRRWPHVVGAIVLGLAMGVALLVTDTHWFTDVIGGALVGAAAVTTLALVEPLLRGLVSSARLPR